MLRRLREKILAAWRRVRRRKRPQPVPLLPGLSLRYFAHPDNGLPALEILAPGMRPLLVRLTWGGRDGDVERR